MVRVVEGGSLRLEGPAALALAPPEAVVRPQADHLDVRMLTEEPAHALGDEPDDLWVGGAQLPVAIALAVQHRVVLRVVLEELRRRQEVAEAVMPHGRLHAAREHLRFEQLRVSLERVLLLVGTTGALACGVVAVVCGTGALACRGAGIPDRRGRLSYRGRPKVGEDHEAVEAVLRHPVNHQRVAVINRHEVGELAVHHRRLVQARAQRQRGLRVARDDLPSLPRMQPDAPQLLEQRVDRMEHRQAVGPGEGYPILGNPVGQASALLAPQVRRVRQVNPETHHRRALPLLNGEPRAGDDRQIAAEFPRGELDCPRRVRLDGDAQRRLSLRCEREPHNPQPLLMLQAPGAHGEAVAQPLMIRSALTGSAWAAVQAVWLHPSLRLRSRSCRDRREPAQRS